MQVNNIRLLEFQRGHCGGRGMAMQTLREATRDRDKRGHGEKMLARDNEGLNQANVSQANKEVWAERRGEIGRD